MSETFKIVRLANGHIRVERLARRNQVHTYQSATFRTEPEARLWIDRQNLVPAILEADYTVASTDSGTYRVMVTRNGGSAPMNLGEFDTEDDANAFVQRMPELDAGPTHGSDAGGH